MLTFFFFFSSRRRHTRYWRDWSSDVCSSDLDAEPRDPASAAADAGLLRSYGISRRDRAEPRRGKGFRGAAGLPHARGHAALHSAAGAATADAVHVIQGMAKPQVFTIGYEGAD